MYSRFLVKHSTILNGSGPSFHLRHLLLELVLVVIGIVSLVEDEAKNSRSKRNGTPGREDVEENLETKERLMTSSGRDASIRFDSLF